MEQRRERDKVLREELRERAENLAETLWKLHGAGRRFSIRLKVYSALKDEGLTESAARRASAVGRARQIGMVVALLEAFLLAPTPKAYPPFPALCADGSVCWTRWDQVAGEWLWVMSDGKPCAVLQKPLGYKKGQSIPTVWWPRSTSECPLVEGQERSYYLQSCDVVACAPPNEPMDWIGQKMAELKIVGGRGCEVTNYFPNLPRCP